MFEKIVAAIDDKPDRAAQVVGAAAELARAFHSEVLVVHVRELERSASLVGAARPGALPPHLPTESEDEARGLIDQAVSRLRDDGVDAQGRVHRGAEDASTAKELVEISRSYGASLVIVGDRGSRVTDVLLGGVAHRIVQMADSPVLLVR